jgi:hypothetical protein
MSRPPRPEPGVEYAAFPTAEFAAARSLEAVASLAKSWGVTEERAADLLDNPGAYAAECRSRRPVRARDALRQLVERNGAPG